MTKSEPIRAKSHVQEESSRLHVKSILNSFGWVVHDVNPDYGEDLFVFVYEDQMATGDLFFVQMKSTVAEDSKKLTYKLRVATVRRWSRLSLPVVLILYRATPEIRCYWTALTSNDWSNLLDSVADGQETITVAQDANRSFDTGSAATLRSAVHVPHQTVDLAPLKSLLRQAETQCEEIRSWLAPYKQEYERFHEATRRAEIKAMAEHGGMGDRHHFFKYRSPHQYMGPVEWGRMCEVLSKRLDRLPKKIPSGVMSDGGAFKNLIAGLQQRILSRNRSPAAEETVRLLAELELSGNDLTIALAKRQKLFRDSTEIEKLLRMCRSVASCIDRIKWSALDLLID